MSQIDFTQTDNQQKASNPKQSVWVSANAGSGKTHVLVERVMRLLLSGVEPASILCITYTKAAAAEMWSRLFERLGAWTNLDDEALAISLQSLNEDGNDKALRVRARQLFTRALETPGGLKIQTIHAFCEKLLHLFPVEAGMAPGFSVMDERRELELQTQAIAFVLNRAERESTSPEAKASAALTEKLSQDDFKSLVLDFVKALRKADPNLLNTTQNDYELVLSDGLGVSHVQLADVEAELGTVDKEAYLHHARLLEPSGKHDRFIPSQMLTLIARSATPVSLLEKFYVTEKGLERGALISVKTAKALPATLEFIDAEKSRVFDLIKLRNTWDIITQSSNAFLLAKEILHHISAEKQRRGLYDFADLITKAASLLSNARATQWVLQKLDQGINHILLDEAQDTSPDQWRIVRSLADEFFAGAGASSEKSRSVFVVGDQKQSIFSFQGADAKGFGQTRDQLLQQTQGQMQTVELTTSYRSTKTVLDAVDKRFTQAALQGLGITDAAERGHTAVRNQQGVVELWPPQSEDKEAEPDAWDKPVDRPSATSANHLLAEKISTMVASWLSKTKPRQLLAQNRAVEPGDILILFQTRSPLYRMVMAQLRQRGVPVAGADRLNLLNSLIVQDLLVVLGWLLLPQDDHALAVILKSPLVPQPLSEEQLFTLCHNRSGPLYSLLTGDNATYLHALQSKAHHNSPFQILSDILTQSRQHIAMRLGPEALEASSAIVDLALDYEAEHGLSLFGFLNWFSATETTLKRDMDKAKGDVRLMTVHGAKGLEAKIVIIADATSVKQPFRSKPSVITLPQGQRAAGLPIWKISGAVPVAAAFESWIEVYKGEMEQEANRLLYVAMTRAADELYITGAKGRNKVDAKAWWPSITQALGEPVGETPLRDGAADVFGAAGPDNAQQPAPPTSWLLQSPPPEPVLHKKSQSPSGNQPTFNAKAVARGLALHRLLQDCADVPAERRFSKARQRAIVLGLTEADAKLVADLVARDDLQIYFGPGSKSETDIIGTAPNGEDMTARMDRLAVLADGVWLLDYKSNDAGAETLSPNHPYVRQLALYSFLLRQAYPAKPVHTALLWTQTGQYQPLPDALITAALQEIEQSKA